MYGERLLGSIRSYQHSWLLVRKLAVLRHRFWSVITGADIPINTKIGQGVNFPHPNGIVIHPCAHIGPGCLIMQQVTIGVKLGIGNDVPHLGQGVDVGAGAKILGGITIGEYAIIGANAVVVKDVPAYAIVAGIPAKVIGWRQTDTSNDEPTSTQRSVAPSPNGIS